MLSRSHRPVEEYVVDYSLLEDEYFKLPKHLKLIKITPVRSNLDFNDDNKTHPNTKLRIERLKELAGDTSFLAKEDVLFEKCIHLAQFEMLNSYIVSKDFIDGLYHCMTLMDRFPDNPFLERAYAMLWYGRCAEENTKSGPHYTSDFRVTKGEIERFYFLFFKQKKYEISTMATREIWKISLKYPNDIFLQELRKRVLSEFVKHTENHLEKFKTVNNIKSLKKKRKSLGSGFSLSIATLLDHPYFINEINTALRKAEDLKQQNKTYLTVRNFTTKDQKKSSVLFAKPLYSQTDLRTSIGNNIVDNETAENTLLSLTRESAAQNNLPVHIFGNLQDSGFTTADYNQMTIYYDYLHENLRFSDFDFLPYNSFRLPQIGYADSTSKSIGFISVQSITYKKSFNGSGAFFSLISGYGFPMYLRWQLEPKQFSYIYMKIYDLKTHNPSTRFIRFSNTPLNVYLESAQVYNAINQINAH